MTEWRYRAALSVGLLGMGLLLAAAACGDDGTGGGGAGSESLEYKLAVVSAGGFVKEDDPSVARFRALLDSLEAKCTEGREKIADMAVKSQELLKDKGVDLTVLRVMQNADASIPDGFGESPCADIFATLVTLTTTE